MAEELNRETQSLFWAELCLLRASGIISDRFEGAKLSNRPTPVYDTTGEVLFYRQSIKNGKTNHAFADLSHSDAFAEPVIAISTDGIWDENNLLKQAMDHARQYYDIPKNELEMRFVAYSYPKVGVQFLKEGKERLMLDLFTWEKISSKDTKTETIGLTRFSYLRSVDEKLRKSNASALKERNRFWEAQFKEQKSLVRDLDILTSKAILGLDWIILPWPLYFERELHYSTRNSDHHICYEVRGQETNVWCVGASVQMMLDFYRYEYTQTRLATELGLGTAANPNGLPYARVGDIATTLETMTNNALSAALVTSPTFNLFKNEILANRPINSIVPGHSRTVAGYRQSALVFFPSGIPTYQGILVYDPWPPNAGVIRRWENFANKNHLWATTAELNKA